MTTQPGALFAGILRAPMRAYLRDVLEGARQRGYNRVVEPACGPFTACQLAVHAGFGIGQLEASDISFFSTVLGRALNRESLADLDIRVDGEPVADDPVEAMWAEVYARTEQKVVGKKQEGGWFYWRDLLTDLELRRAEHLDAIRKTVDRLRESLGGVSYRPLDMFEHIAEAEDDEHAILMLAPPTYRGGYEKIEDTGGRLTWRSPAYTMFDPETGIDQLGERMAASPALWLMYLESETQEQELPAVFAHGLVRAAKGVAARTMNAYLVTNRPDEVEALATGRAVHWSPELPKPTLPSLPPDFEPSRRSRLQVRPISEAEYWRKLWLHNFRSLSQAIGAGVFIDGYLCGIFGYDYQTKGGRLCLLTYHVGVPGNEAMRWQRVVIRAAMTREAMRIVLGDLGAGAIEEVRTSMFSPHPSSMAQRGLMKLRERKVHPRRGFQLAYAGPVREISVQRAWQEAFDDEERWRKRRGADETA